MTEPLCVPFYRLGNDSQLPQPEALSGSTKYKLFPGAGFSECTLKEYVPGVHTHRVSIFIDVKFPDYRIKVVPSNGTPFCVQTNLLKPYSNQLFPSLGFSSTEWRNTVIIENYGKEPYLIKKDTPIISIVHEDGFPIKLVECTSWEFLAEEKKYREASENIQRKRFRDELKIEIITGVTQNIRDEIDRSLEKVEKEIKNGTDQLKQLVIESLEKSKVSYQVAGEGRELVIQTQTQTSSQTQTQTSSQTPAQDEDVETTTNFIGMRTIWREKDLTDWLNEEAADLPPFQTFHADAFSTGNIRLILSKRPNYAGIIPQELLTPELLVDIISPDPGIVLKLPESLITLNFYDVLVSAHERDPDIGADLAIGVMLARFCKLRNMNVFEQKSKLYSDLCERHPNMICPLMLKTRELGETFRPIIKNTIKNSHDMLSRMSPAVMHTVLRAIITSE
jgi:hypothetical protein